MVYWRIWLGIFFKSRSHTEVLVNFSPYTELTYACMKFRASLWPASRLGNVMCNILITCKKPTFPSLLPQYYIRFQDLINCIPLRSNWLVVLFRYPIFWLTFCLVLLSSMEKSMLIFPLWPQISVFSFFVMLIVYLCFELIFWMYTSLNLLYLRARLMAIIIDYSSLSLVILFLYSLFCVT